MKEIQLRRGGVSLVDDSDYDFLMQWEWSALKKRNGFYAGRYGWAAGKSFTIYMHRQILGSPDLSILVDHKDHNTLNNQKSNLRLCTNSQNQQNRRKAPGTTSKYRGVYLCDRNVKKWYSKIEINKKQKFIGRFETEIEAALAYNEKAKEAFGEFANLNQITHEEICSPVS